MPSKKKKYNARFPPARIKKIMQTDEDVGKVAAAVPVIISRALELFIESLITKTSKTTKARNAKTLSTQHIKQTILSEKEFDFLKDLVANIPDVQPSEEDCGESSHAVEKPPGPRPRGRPRKRKPENEDGAPIRKKKVQIQAAKSSEDESETEDANSDVGDDDDDTDTSDGFSPSTALAPSVSALPTSQLGVPFAAAVPGPSASHMPMYTDTIPGHRLSPIAKTSPTPLQTSPIKQTGTASPRRGASPVLTGGGQMHMETDAATLMPHSLATYGTSLPVATKLGRPVAASQHAVPTLPMPMPQFTAAAHTDMPLDMSTNKSAEAKASRAQTPDEHKSNLPDSVPMRPQVARTSPVPVTTAQGTAPVGSALPLPPAAHVPFSASRLPHGHLAMPRMAGVPVPGMPPHLYSPLVPLPNSYLPSASRPVAANMHPYLPPAAASFSVHQRPAASATSKDSKDDDYNS